MVKFSISDGNGWVRWGAKGGGEGFKFNKEEGGIGNEECGAKEMLPNILVASSSFSSSFFLDILG